MFAIIGTNVYICVEPRATACNHS